MLLYVMCKFHSESTLYSLNVKELLVQKDAISQVLVTALGFEPTTT